MGYCYERSTNRLCCDSCGEPGARKRTCPHKVYSTVNGERVGLPYCTAPALCTPCWNREGKSAGVHKNCAEPAAESQRRSDEVDAGYAAGRLHVRAAFGDWHENVEHGWVGVIFRNGDNEQMVLVPDAVYDPSHNGRPWLDQYSVTKPWVGPDAVLA